jgi:hypothetical protein
MDRKTELVSISEAARRTGRDFRTVNKIIHLAQVWVVTRTGNLYDLNEIQALLNHGSTSTDGQPEWSLAKLT